MGHKSQEITSGPLSASYPSYYCERQIRNWTPVDIVVTEPNGAQHLLPKDGTTRTTDAFVEIEYRSVDGMRCEATDFGMTNLPLNGHRIQIPFEDIRNSPYRVVEHNLIVSTYDHAVLAKDMLHASMYDHNRSETRVDDDLVDPRLVFQVDDPMHQWNELYVNIFGQTIVVRAGYWSELLPVIETGSANVESTNKGRLVCYLRYPNDYCSGVRPTNTVFEVSLDCLTNEEPIRLPSGDVLCVAPTLEQLQNVLAKKMAGYTGVTPANLITSQMVTKEVYDAAQAAAAAELDRVKKEDKIKYETLATNKDNEISKITAQRDKAIQERDALAYQVEQWAAYAKTSAAVKVDESTILSAIDKARKESYEASRRDIESMWGVLKISAAIVTGILTFGVALYVKNNKK